MKFCILTLGCKVNQYETQAIVSILISRGHEQAEAGKGCDACIINTCAVTAESVRKSRQAVRRMKKIEPGALIAVCGCLSQIEPSTAFTLCADLVGGSGDRYKFALELESIFNERASYADSISTDTINSHFDKNGLSVTDEGFARDTERQVKIVTGDPMQMHVFEELPPGAPLQAKTGAARRTRALLKIQDGCDNYCAYCVIPYARGHSRSLSEARAADYARRIGEQGFREIVVTGIEISSYGKDLADKPTLADVVRGISAAAPSSRLRLGSLDPRTITEGFCREMSDISNLCGHFHLSLQSGCDKTLRRMGRKYDTNAVRDAISSLRSRFPDCGITADLITGFPGETDAEFEQTLEFIKSASFSDMHIFPFSPRPGTRAAIMPEQVEKIVGRERAHIAAAAAAGMAQEFRLGLIGKTVDVLFERERGGRWVGYSGNYIEVAAKNGGARNSVHNVQISGLEEGHVWGEII